MEKGLLYYLNGNIQMGMESTRYMIEICDDERLRAAMLDDLYAYEKFENAVVKIRGDQKIKPLSTMAEMGTEMAIDMKTLFNDSPEDQLELAKGYLNFMKQGLARYTGWR